ncbi:MAG: TolB family protein [Promethearchaeota archaeon]
MKFSKVRVLSPCNGKHHFFGYYGISPWSADGRYFVCLETDFHDHLPALGEVARVVLLDLHEGEARVIADTRGWNFQQGAMLHWLPSGSSRKVIFNDCGGDGAFSRVIDVETGDGWDLPRPVNAVAKNKDLGACVSFARLRTYRKVTSLPCSNDYSKGGVHPRDDGLFIMDLKGGSLDLIVTLDEIWNANGVTAGFPDADFQAMGMGLWFNHVSFNPSGTRLHFLARFPNLFKGLVTSMWTVGTDGSDKHLLVDFYHRLSHFEWVNDTDLVVTMDWPDLKQKSHVRITDRIPVADAKAVNWKVIAGDVLVRDGHPAVRPDKTLMATDTYIVDGRRYVYLVDLKTGAVDVVHSFRNPPAYSGEIRCDPHPRWSPDGKQLSFDALCPGGRQVHVVDID